MDKQTLFRPKDVKEFQALFEKHTGEKLNAKTAYQKLVMLVRLVEVTSSSPLVNENRNGYEYDYARNSNSK